MDQRRQHRELHIVPVAGAVKLTKVTVPWIRSFQDELREGGRSPAMIKRVTVSLGSILADAQGRGLVVRNAVHELSKARSGTKKSEKRAKVKLRGGVDIPTNAEIRQILDAAEGRYRPLLVTMVFTGIRASEARGLRWEDVDLAKAQLHVRQRADRYGEVGMPKSEAGQRTVPLPPMVVNTLRNGGSLARRARRGWCSRTQPAISNITRTCSRGAYGRRRRRQGWWWRAGKRMRKVSRSWCRNIPVSTRSDIGTQAGRSIGSQMGGAGAAGENRADADGPQFHPGDVRHLRAPVPIDGRRSRNGRRGEGAFLCLRGRIKHS